MPRSKHRRKPGGKAVAHPGTVFHRTYKVDDYVHPGIRPPTRKEIAAFQLYQRACAWGSRRSAGPVHITPATRHVLKLFIDSRTEQRLPVPTAADVPHRAAVSKRTAYRALKQLCELGILTAHPSATAPLESRTYRLRDSQHWLGYEGQLPQHRLPDRRWEFGLVPWPDEDYQAA